MNYRRKVNLFLFLLLLILSACTQNKVHYFPRASEKMVAKDKLAQAQIAILVTSPDLKQTIMSQNSEKLLMPASTLKLFTTFTALHKYGPDYKFFSELSVIGEIKNKTLKGDLIFTPRGNPGFSSNFSKTRPDSILIAFADSLKSIGINTIEGDFILNKESFQFTPSGEGWCWDDLDYDFSAPRSRFVFNDNCQDYYFLKGNISSDSLKYVVFPVFGDSLQIITQSVYDSTTSYPYLFRNPDTDSLQIITFPKNTQKDYKRRIAIRNPDQYWMQYFASILLTKGIILKGNILIRNTVSFKPAFSFKFSSPKLSEIIQVTNKRSYNLYAEQLLGLLGKNDAEAFQTMRKELTCLNTNPDSFWGVDGSGQSRYNLTTAKELNKLLSEIYFDSNYQEFKKSLPIAGVDGTIKARFKDSSIKGKLYAKTGSQRFVNNLSGYLETKSGKTLLITFLCNNYGKEKQAVLDMQKNLLEYLYENY